MLFYLIIIYFLTFIIFQTQMIIISKSSGLSFLSNIISFLTIIWNNSLFNINLLSFSNNDFILIVMIALKLLGTKFTFIDLKLFWSKL